MSYVDPTCSERPLLQCKSKFGLAVFAIPVGKSTTKNGGEALLEPCQLKCLCNNGIQSPGLFIQDQNYHF